MKDINNIIAKVIESSLFQRHIDRTKRIHSKVCVIEYPLRIEKT